MPPREGSRRHSAASLSTKTARKPRLQPPPGKWGTECRDKGVVLYATGGEGGAGLRPDSLGGTPMVAFLQQITRTPAPCSITSLEPGMASQGEKRK
jgi:hypothetical protein